MSDTRGPEAYDIHEREWESYDDLRESFEWEIPDRFNIAEYACTRWATGDGRVAIHSEGQDGEKRTYTFDDLDRASGAFAHYLAGRGIGRGDWVGVNTPQRPETVITHLAAWKLGAGTVPLSVLFGPEALRYRLADVGATVCVVDGSNVDNLREVRPDLPALETVVTVGVDDGAADEDDGAADEDDFWRVVESGPATFDPVETDPEDDAVILYTSGSTGSPKGVRHVHRVLLGHLPPFVTCLCNTSIDDSTLVWKPASWAWSTLFDGVFPPLFFGRPILASGGGRFDPERTFQLIDEYEVTNFSVPPTALRKMMQVDGASERYSLRSIRVIQSGGESLDGTTIDWVGETFENASIHEAYGQTEANMLVADCTALGAFERGTMGRPCPGFEVAILDPDTAEPLPDPGAVGEIAVRYEGNPICFTEYWNKPERTAAKLRNGWLLTEDLGRMDEAGYVTFEGRKDGVIISAGYRIGPGEVEAVLGSHPAVADCGVVGAPDDERGEVPVAFVVRADGSGDDPGLAAELKRFVKEELAKYEYPREITMVDELPQTTTGKVDRKALERAAGS